MLKMLIYNTINCLGSKFVDFCFHSLAQETLPDINRVAGSTVDLQPGSTGSSISSVTWKHGIDLAVEWFGQKETYYREFNGIFMSYWTLQSCQT